MMRPLRTRLLVWLLLGLGVPAHAELYVIVQADSPIESLTMEQLSAIALGRSVRLPGDVRAEFVDQSTSRRVFHAFHYGVNDMSELQLNSHWARIVFTGRGKRPRRLPDDQAVIQAVLQNPRLIGYLGAEPSQERSRVRVLLRLEEPGRR